MTAPTHLIGDMMLGQCRYQYQQHQYQQREHPLDVYQPGGERS
ncbi:MAG: hypothetical protein AAF708_16660 [Deinococcota bacterium]